MFRRDFCKLGIVGVGSALIKPTISLGQSNKKTWAVVYSTWCGSTKEVAAAIASGIGEAAEIVDVKSNPEISNYEHFVIGGAIRAGKTSTEFQNFIKNNKVELAKKVRGIFVVCGNGGNANVDQNSTYITSIKGQSLWGQSMDSVSSKVFPGRFNKDYCDQNDSMAKSLTMQPYDNLSIAIPQAEEFGKSLGSTSIRERIFEKKNSGFQLFQNDPNPFRRTTKIRYHINEPCHVKLNIYSISGKKVEELVSGFHLAGDYEIKWNRKDILPGYYIYCLDAGGKFNDKKVAIVLP